MVAEHNFEHERDVDTAYMVNHIVASLGVLNVKLHQYHWYVQGPGFFTLHGKFEELYDAVNANFDAFAERLISMGEKPYSTLEEYLEHSFIKEKVYDKKIESNKMVENIVEDYRTLADVTSRAIELAGKEGDTVTEDLMVAYKDSLDTNIWMLQAYIGKGATEGK